MLAVVHSLTPQWRAIIPVCRWDQIFHDLKPGTYRSSGLHSPSLFHGGLIVDPVGHLDFAVVRGAPRSDRADQQLGARAATAHGKGRRSVFHRRIGRDRGGDLRAVIHRRCRFADDPIGPDDWHGGGSAYDRQFPRELVQTFLSRRAVPLQAGLEACNSVVRGLSADHLTQARERYCSKRCAPHGRIPTFAVFAFSHSWAA